MGCFILLIFALLIERSTGRLESEGILHATHISKILEDKFGGFKYYIYICLTNLNHIAMHITINTPNQIFKTIGHTEKFEPVLYFKIGQRKQAIKDLTDYFNEFDKVLATGIQFTENDWEKYATQFEEKAKVKALETIERVVEFNNKFFTFLPVIKK